MRWAIVVGSVWAVLSSIGCATIVSGAGPEYKVRCASEPQGAKVYFNNEYKGVTPIAVPVTRKDKHQVRVEQAGYATYEKELKPIGNPAVFGNILFGGIIGVVVDLASGAAVIPSPGEIKVDFEKIKAKAERDAAKAERKRLRRAAKGQVS